MARKQASSQDAKAPARAGSGGKVANDHNKRGLQVPAQKNEPRRTPDSRHDRDSQLGADNQSRVRKGDAGLSSGGKAR